MILPTKYITTENSLLGLGALILTRLDKPVTVSSLWEEMRNSPQIATYERFTLCLDFLYMVNALEYDEGKLRRAAK